MGRAHRNMVAARLRKRQETAEVNNASGPLKLKSTQAQNIQQPTINGGLVDKTSSANNAVAALANLTPTPVNLLDMHGYQRKALAQGPLLMFFLGGTFLVSIPAAVFISTSNKVAQLLSSPSVNEVKLPTGLNISFIQHLLEWVKSCTTKNTIHAPPLRRELDEALHLYHAADALGLLAYIDNTLKYQKHRFCNTIPSEAMISTIEDSAIHEGHDDFFFASLTERIAYIIRKDVLSADEKEEYMKMIENHPKVAAAVQQINVPWVRRRAAEARRLERERKAVAAEAKAIERAAIKKAQRMEAAKQLYREDMEARGPLLEKLKGQSKVLTLTRNEIELVERLRGHGDVEVGKWI